MSSLSKIWLSSPHMSGKEQDYIQQAFDLNWIAPVGPNIASFEQKIENFLVGNRHVVALNSGTAALHLALQMAEVTCGDEVLCQSFSFCASAFPITYLGARPVFIDSEPETWNMCPKLLETVIKDKIQKGKKPKAIILVHLYGMPAKVEQIAAVASKYDIVLIEDAAEALGSSVNDTPCGSFGDFAIFSFNGNKIITTSGGGALVCKTQEQKEKAIYLATQARDESAYYSHSQIGYNYRLSNVLAGIGIGQMEVLKERVLARRKNHEFYSELLSGVPGIMMLKEPEENYYSNHWLSCIVIDKDKAGFDHYKLRSALEEEEIESRFLWKPLHTQPVFQATESYSNGCSQYLFDHGLCLPSGSNLTANDKDRISTVLKQFI